MKFTVKIIRTVEVDVDTDDAWHYEDYGDMEPEEVAAAMAIFDAEQTPEFQEEVARSVIVRVGSVTAVSE